MKIFLSLAGALKSYKLLSIEDPGPCGSNHFIPSCSGVLETDSGPVGGGGGVYIPGSDADLIQVAPKT